MRHLIVLLFLALSLSACGQGNAGGGVSPAAAKPSYEIEVIVRTGENFRSAADVAAFVDRAARHHVAAINLLVKQDEDGTIASGRTFYASALAPAAPGYEQFDVLRAMLDAARPRGIQVHAWMPQFHDQVAALRQPAWQMRAWVGGQAVPYTGARQTEFFVNPLDPEVQAYQRALIRELVSRYAVDGVMLDWIRFDNYNMDLGDATRARYLALSGVDPATLDFANPSAALAAWNAFRTDALAAYVQAVRQDVPAALRLGVYILPPEFVEVGQDAAKFSGQLGQLAPMCYFRDWGFDVSWWWSSCMPASAARAGAADLVPAMDSDLSDAQYAQIFSHLQSDLPQVRRISWFHHGLWDEALLARIAALSGH